MASAELSEGVLRGSPPDPCLTPLRSCGTARLESLGRTCVPQALQAGRCSGREPAEELAWENLDKWTLTLSLGKYCWGRSDGRGGLGF